MILLSEQFQTPMNIEITIVKTFCEFGHNFFKKQPFWPFFIRILAISCEKKSGNPAQNQVQNELPEKRLMCRLEEEEVNKTNVGSYCEILSLASRCQAKSYEETIKS